MINCERVSYESKVSKTKGRLGVWASGCRPRAQMTLVPVKGWRIIGQKFTIFLSKKNCKKSRKVADNNVQQLSFFFILIRHFKQLRSEDVS